MTRVRNRSHRWSMVTVHSVPVADLACRETNFPCRAIWSLMPVIWIADGKSEMILLAAAAALLTPPGMIDDSDARTLHSFSPSPDCAEWAKARRRARPRFNPHEAWILGLLSGYNMYHPKGHRDILEGSSTEAAFAWIDRRCGGDRNLSLIDVTSELMAELRAKVGS